MQYRSGPATVTGSKSAGNVTEGNLGKAQRSDELKPGELPSRQSPFDLRVMGRGFAIL